jgi:hypothetical protein
VDKPAFPKPMTVIFLPYLFYISRVFPYYASLGQQMDALFSRFFLALNARLPPAKKPLIGFDFYKKPILPVSSD